MGAAVESLLDLLLLPGVAALLGGLLEGGVLVLLLVAADCPLAAGVDDFLLGVAVFTGSVLLDFDREVRVAVFDSSSRFIAAGVLEMLPTDFACKF